jgi:hypothetical protein
MPNFREDAAVQTARREAWVVLGIFVSAMVYTVTYCYVSGYDRPPETLTFVFGFPDWVFWGILVPWGVCLLLSFWFGHTFMRDADLGISADPAGGEETEEGL